MPINAPLKVVEISFSRKVGTPAASAACSSSRIALKPSPKVERSIVRAIATEILDAVTPLGECEAVEAIASRLPAMVIGDLLGYPRELWERVRYWSEQTMVLSGQTSPDGPPHVMHPGIPPVVQDFAETTTKLIMARRAEASGSSRSRAINGPGSISNFGRATVISVRRLGSGAKASRGQTRSAWPRAIKAAAT